MTDLERANLGLGERPALLVVDMIKGFTDASCPLGCDCPDVVAANAQLILDEQLRALGVDSLVVTGLTTSGCVRASAVDGLQYDYRVVVPREAVGDRNPDAHEANLFDLHAKYADVVTVADVLENL